MIVVRDSLGNYHETVAIYDNSGREIAEVRDNQGRLLFKNWDEIQGSLPLNFTSRADYLQDYRIYGNTVQDGTPTPETPVEVLGCGEYDSELNGYKISVTVTDGTNSITTPVYIGNEPLHKIRNYADYVDDYVDFKRGMVVRRIKKLVLTGEENWFKYGNTAHTFAFHNYVRYGLCSHYAKYYSSDIDRRDGAYLSNGKTVIITDLRFTEISDFKSFLAAQYAAGTPVTIWYVLLAEPEEEPLENLLPIQTIKGSDVLTVGTAVQPSEMYIKYKKG